MKLCLDSCMLIQDGSLLIPVPVFTTKACQNYIKFLDGKVINLGNKKQSVATIHLFLGSQATSECYNAISTTMRVCNDAPMLRLLFHGCWKLKLPCAGSHLANTAMDSSEAFAFNTHL